MSRKILFSLMVFCTFFVLAGLPALAQDEFIFGVILVGPKTDRGWSQAHYEGGLYVEENVPGASMRVYESLNAVDAPETTLLDVVTEMVGEGAQLIITTSDYFELDTDTVAAEFPEVAFINASGQNALDVRPADLFPEMFEGAEAEAHEPLPNVGNVMGQMEWGKEIAGCAAALTTETGQIGYLGPLINHETRRFVASAYLGARYCYENYSGGNPDDLEFTVTWIGFWFNIPGVTLDPTEEANTFFDSGVDVVISGIDTTEALDVAGQRAEAGESVFAIGYDYANACDQAPDVCLGVPYYNWGPSYADIATQVNEGTWEPGWDWVAPDWENINSPTSAVGFNVGPALSEEDRASLDAFIAEMTAFATDPANEDNIFLWQGPLNFQDGTELAPEGEFVEPLKVWYLPQLLEGMIGASE